MDAAAVVLCLRDWRDCLPDGLPDLCGEEQLRPSETLRVKSSQNCGEFSCRKPGGTSAPVTDERIAWRVPDLGNTMCQKSTLGLTKAMPTNRLSRFSRKEVTTQSTDLAVCSLRTLTVWPGINGVSISTRAP